MGILGLGGKKESERKCRCSGCMKETEETKGSRTHEANVKILGGGCSKCNALEAATIEALGELGMESTTIEHVRDFERIAAYGVMSTPALIVDGHVVSCGKVLKKDEIKAILEKTSRQSTNQ